MSPVVLPFESVSILNKFCFPWWYYPCFAVGKWCLAGIIAKIFTGFESRENNLKTMILEQPLLMKEKKHEKVWNVLNKMTNLPNDVIDEILSYITFEISFDMMKDIHNKLDFKIFFGYLIIYMIIDGLLNVYCWYMAINHWIDAFKIETNGWNRFILFTFDSLVILPSYVPVFVLSHFVAFGEIIAKKLDYYEQYYDDRRYCIYKYIIICLCFIINALQVTPFIIAVLPSFYCALLPGMFITFPVLLFNFLMSMCIAFQFIIAEFDIQEGIWYKFFNGTAILSVIITLMVSYGSLTVTFTTTVCIYNGNKWNECLEYGITSEYCPQFNFDYTFDSWIWIIKWTLF